MGLIIPNKAVPAVKKTVDKNYLRTRALELLSAETEDAEGNVRTEIDQILGRAINTAKYAKSDKDATSTAKWLWEITYGKSPVAVEEKEEDLTEIVFRVNTKDKALLEAAKDRGDLECVDEEVYDDKVEIVIDEDGEDDVTFRV